MKQEDINNLKKMLFDILDDLDKRPDIVKINFNLGVTSDFVKNLIVLEHNCEYSAVLRRMKKK